MWITSFCTCALVFFRHNCCILVGPGAVLNTFAVSTLIQRMKTASFVSVNVYKNPNCSIAQHGESRIFSLSLQLLHRFALLLQSGSHRLHYSRLEKLRPSEKQRHISEQWNVVSAREGLMLHKQLIISFMRLLWKEMSHNLLWHVGIDSTLYDNHRGSQVWILLKYHCHKLHSSHHFMLSK